MVGTIIIYAILLSLVSQTINAQSPLKFMGREVTIIAPGRDADDVSSPRGPVSICLEGPPQRQCYTAPQEFGNSPEVTVVQPKKDLPALLFSAASGGVTGWGIHFALLRPGTGKDLQDFFGSDMTVSDQSQHAFWRDLLISDAQIFVTADYVWGPDEAHSGEHRYIISAYVNVHRPPSLVDDLYYYLEDRYMTARKYDLDAKADVLASEKSEILARLRRLSPHQRAPR
ncbi:MAG TPA: hypothetical protein VKR43_06100 [Bryobacteraceae bacterium]|nr:hypothetical protein [Bryobacteraceae bacterium]